MFDPDTNLPCQICPAVNFGDRAEHLSIDILLLHYTGMHSGTAAVDWLCCEESQVSCHYLVHENGEIVQMVPESKRAWHAGLSSWQGESDTNSRSIGIEIVNRGHQLDYPEFPVVQINTVASLCQDILTRHPIPQYNVLAHSDVAPGRKPDPGEKFPWKILFDRGIGHWVEEAPKETGVTYQLGEEGAEIASLQTDLARYGYRIEVNGIFDKQTFDVVVAFQRHFRPSLVDSIADCSTRNTLKSLLDALTQVSLDPKAIAKGEPVF